MGLETLGESLRKWCFRKREWKDAKIGLLKPRKETYLKKVFADIFVLKISRQDHPGFEQALNPMANVLRRKRGEETQGRLRDNGNRDWILHQTLEGARKGSLLELLEGAS